MWRHHIVYDSTMIHWTMSAYHLIIYRRVSEQTNEHSYITKRLGRKNERVRVEMD